MIDATHYGTEKPAMLLLAKNIEAFGKKNGWKIEISQTETEKAPFTHIDIHNYIENK